jgi:hypothetical protein
MDEILEKQDTTAGMEGSASTPQGGVNSAMGAMSKDEDEEEEKKDKEKDKKMIEEKMDEHNEKKHGEPKDEDSAITKKEDCEKSELVKFHSNGQWSLNKAEPTPSVEKPSSIMPPKSTPTPASTPPGDNSGNSKPKPKSKEWDHSTPDPIKKEK